MTDTTMTAVVDRWVMYTDASGNERPAHVVRETKIDGVTVLGVEAAGPGLVWVPIDRVIRSASTQLGLVPTDALNALAGTWPGDDTDEELAGAMRDWDGYITPQPTVTTHRCIPIARLAELEAAEAQLAALRIEMECLADSVARERLTHDGDLADIPGPGALERLGDAERLARAALTDATATAEQYTRRVRAQALRMVADAWEREAAANGYECDDDDPTRMEWSPRGLRAEAERIEGGS